MKLRQSIYHSIGLAIAMVFTLLFVITILGGVETSSRTNAHPTAFLEKLALQLVVILFIGVGSLLNLLSRRFVSPTLYLVVGVYCLSVIFLPLGIWGVVEIMLHRSQKRQRRPSQNRRRATPEVTPATGPVFGFASWYAPISCLGAALGGGLLASLFYWQPAVGAGIMLRGAAMGLLLLGICFGLLAVARLRDTAIRRTLMTALVGLFLSSVLLTVDSLPFLFVLQHHLLPTSQQGMDPASAAKPDPSGILQAPYP